MLRSNDPTLKICRLKNWLTADVNQAVMNRILDALENNKVVEALYIQNFEKAMLDPQLRRLTQVLRHDARYFPRLLAPRLLVLCSRGQAHWGTIVYRLRILCDVYMHTMDGWPPAAQLVLPSDAEGSWMDPAYEE